MAKKFLSKGFPKNTICETIQKHRLIFNTYLLSLLHIRHSLPTTLSFAMFLRLQTIAIICNQNPKPRGEGIPLENE